MTAPATADQRADRERDYLKHEWRPGDPAPLDQRLAVAQLVGYCESIAKSGILSEGSEFNLRKIIAETLVAFGMPSKADREAA